MKKLFSVMLLAVASAFCLALTACGGGQPQTPYVPPASLAASDAVQGATAQPVQAQAQQSGIDGQSAAIGAIGGGLLGYMAGRSSTPPAQHIHHYSQPQPVVNRTTIIKRTVYVAPRSTYSRSAGSFSRGRR